MTATAYPCPLCGNDLGTQPVACTGCTERGRRDLADLPRLATLLLGMARDARRNASEPISGSRERPLPLRTGLWSFVGLAPPGTVSAVNPPKGWTPGDALCQVGDIPLADTLATTCRAVADDLHGTAPRVRRHGDPDEAVARFSSYLRAQHDRTCRLPWADGYLTELHDLWRRARTLAQDWPLVHKLPAWCPYCLTLTLRRDNGAAFVYCCRRNGGCGRNWDEEAYPRLVYMLVSEAKESGWATS